jgi:hypothetical protein
LSLHTPRLLSPKESDKTTEILGDAPAGTYLLEQIEGGVRLWRISEGEPEAEAYVPLPLWPLLLCPD